MTEYRQGYLYGCSERSESPDGLVRGDYDFALLSSSWDRRCLSISECTHLTLGHSVLVLFDAVDDLGLREAHDKTLMDFANRVSQTAEVIRGDSHDIQQLWHSLINIVAKVHKGRSRPLRILIDLSSCPRYLSIGLACDSIQSGVASEVGVRSANCVADGR